MIQPQIVSEIRFSSSIWIKISGVIGIIISAFSFAYLYFLYTIAGMNIMLGVVAIVGLIAMKFCFDIFRYTIHSYFEISNSEYIYFDGKEIKNRGNLDNVFFVYKANGYFYIEVFEGEGEVIPITFAKSVNVIEALRRK